MTIRHDPTGTIAEGTLGFSAFHRQWIGLSIAGDSVDVEPIDWAALGNDVYMESLDIEVSINSQLRKLPHILY